ncbi:hypothetical protein [Streptomyces sp. MS1.AVA.4]|uniref:Uncharacterized protein n=1 Tax=Streptomyces pratisoli TaxID=3139917 RepID=A0ACC6QHR2_9ACTN
MSQPMYAPQQPQQPQRGGPEKKRNWFARHKVLTALGAVVVLVAIGSAAGGGEDSSSGSTAAGSSKGAAQDAAKGTGDSKPKEETKKKAAAIEGDGDFEVPADIKPGLYRTSGNDGMCYWERAKDSKGEVDSILANDNVNGTSYVTLKPSDKIFKTTGCKDWEAVDEKAKGSPKSEIKGDGGMFKVGVDIAPGTYKSTGNTDDMCYWERSKDAAHGIDSILANENVKGTAIVKIGASDGYFKTTNCQDWKKTG